MPSICVKRMKCEHSVASELRPRKIIIKIIQEKHPSFTCSYFCLAIYCALWLPAAGKAKGLAGWTPLPGLSYGGLFYYCYSAGGISPALTN